MYDVLLTTGSTSNINNLKDFTGSDKTLEIPYNPPILPRNHNVFSNKKTENLERLENQLQYYCYLMVCPICAGFETICQTIK